MHNTIQLRQYPVHHHPVHHYPAEMVKAAASLTPAAAVLSLAMASTFMDQHS